ncbi:PREDICTED: uncharacterized protein LOC104827677 [Tarenaya hassleriana]|uniref:uncharacterized protein LOC104827677 n=1 Tax=Tarenaya hassleriana TaxID=28532 RepID=UPI00053C75C9|nr:PREDICTED: uncharacterized protein LOC104827677 [Tarenaya hassleriana]XP_010559209.1 PREDICTED: uncharacterized protein LOC104827677 [Tarenaya hassleriana]
MKRREEKRREFHEALLRTLYPPPSSPPPPVVDDKPLDVTFLDPDYVSIGSSDSEDEYEDGVGDELNTAQKPSRAQRKRLRKKMLKEEAVRRGKLIGPLLPSTTAETRRTVADTHSDSEIGGGGSGEQCVRGNAPENKEKFCGRDKMGRVKKRRVAKKMAKGSSKPVQPLISETQD